MRTPLFIRIAALAGGLVILLGAAIPTFGVVLAAPVGVWAVYRHRRAHQRRLSMWDSWFGAAIGAAVAMLIGAGVITAMVPAGSWRSIRQTADSVSAEGAKQPPPEWLSRVFPTAGRSSKSTVAAPAPFNTFTMLWGLGFAIVILGAVIGTVGWAGAMLLVFSATGRWPPTPAMAHIDPSDA